jgi:hypothetical protein
VLPRSSALHGSRELDIKAEKVCGNDIGGGINLPDDSDRPFWRSPLVEDSLNR